MSATIAEALRRVDRTGQLADVLALPDQLRDALWRVESASELMEGWDSPAGLIVAGMGGPAGGGGLGRVIIG